MNSTPPTNTIKAGSRLWKVVRLVVLSLAALAVVAWLAVGYVAAGQLTVPEKLFDPSRTPETYGMAYEAVDFTSLDGSTRLSGWYIPSQQNVKSIVFVHGRNASRTAAYGSSANEQADRTCPAGCWSWLPR